MVKICYMNNAYDQTMLVIFRRREYKYFFIRR